jgi:cytochrome c peroxidase
VSLRVAAVLGGVGLLAGLGALVHPERASDRALRGALGRAGVHAISLPPRDDPRLVALGRRLFFDPILSGNRDVSCSSCHAPRHALGDGLALELAAPRHATRSPGPRNTIAIFNVGLGGFDRFFWDGRVSGEPATGALSTPSRRLPANVAAALDGPLAAQALFPVVSVLEMRGAPGSNEVANARDDAAVWAALTARLLADASYRALLRAAFPSVGRLEDLTFGHAARAIAAFERAAFVALDTPFDRFLRGEGSALDEREKRGARLFFGRARCAACHRGPLLTDLDLHALAVPQVGPGKSPGEDRGLGAVTTRPQDDYRFRTPPLRNVALTAPYMHDGCFATLESVVRHHLDPRASYLHYSGDELPEGLRATIDRDPVRSKQRLDRLDPLLARPIVLADVEVADLVRFLGALTDPSWARPSEDLVAR